MTNGKLIIMLIIFIASMLAVKAAIRDQCIVCGQGTSQAVKGLPMCSGCIERAVCEEYGIK